MATSLASQLQAIKSIIKGTQDPIRAPRTRPSVIFDPKEAADVDLRTILPIALSGLEVLIENDERFNGYKGSLFSDTSLDLDREKMVPEENEKLNKSIHSFLRLLSGHLQLPAALKTMEYLIRRYQIHVFNMDELVLAVLPYHDTHTFVRIVQLLDLRNSKWAFLDGVKAMGAPPPRNVIVQQCIRDKGLLEALCSYASPTKEFQHSGTTIHFCTAVVVESLGAIPKLDTDIVQRVSGFVFDGLNPAMKGDRDHKAGALMIVGILATRATLSSKLVQNLIFFIARVAQHDTIKSIDLPWLRVLAMAMITLVQSQSAQTFPKKILMILKEIRDFAGVLSDLSREFNIQMFMLLYLESLVDYSMSDDSCCSTLIIMIEALPLRNFVEKIVFKVLLHCTKFSQATDISKLHQAGQWAKEILVVIERHYPFELRGAIRKFLENSKTNLRKESVFEMMFGGSMDMPMEISDSKVWFSLEHPKAVVRQSALSKLAASGILQNMTVNPQIASVQDAVVRGLYDEDLGVVQTALSMDGLDGIVSPSCLLKAYGDVLSRCIGIINKSTSKVSRACDVAVSCLNHMVMEFQMHHLEYSKDVARIIFPLLLVHPMTWKVNLKALELAKNVQWPFYFQSSVAYDPIIFDEMKNLDSDHAASINMKTIGVLAEAFWANPQEHIQWLVECSSYDGLSKSLFFFIILQAMMNHNKEFGGIVKLYQSCSSTLKNEWNKMKLHGGVTLNEDINVDKLDKSCMGLVNHLFHSEAESLNAKIMICIFWSLLKAFHAMANESTLADDGEGEPILNDLFLFFVTAQPRNAFTKHLQFLLINCTREPFRFLSKYFSDEGFPVEVQVESLRLLATVCSIYSLSERSSLGGNSCLQFLSGFPSLLIPLSHTDKDIRTSAMSCIEGLYILWRRFEVSPLRNGNDPTISCLWSPTFGDFLESLVNQKELISSDVKFLHTCVTSMLNSSSHDLLLPENISDRFDLLTKESLLHFILRSALKFSSYGKLMVLSLLKGIGNFIFHEKGTKKLLLRLVDGRSHCEPGSADLHGKLSILEIETLCLLLEVSLSASNAADLDADILGSLINALRVHGLSSADPCIVRPCVTVLQNLKPTFYDSLKNEIQEKFFGNLVFLFHNANGDIRNATRDTLLRININCSTVIRLIEVILGQGHAIGSSKRMKGEDMTYGRFGLYQNAFDRNEEPFLILVSLLDILCLKKKMRKRSSLIQPLFRVLSELFSNGWLVNLCEQGAKGSGEESEVSESVSGVVYQAQQTTLLILKDITDSLEMDLPVKEDLFNKVTMDLLVACARSAKDVATRNHVFLLLSSIARVSPEQISGNIMDIFTVIGESALKQNDSYSQHVLEDLISTLVPCWLSKTNSIEKLLQIFIKALPDVAEHRRLTLIVYLLRTLGEEGSLSILLFHLLHSLVHRLVESSPEQQRNLQDLFSSHSATITEWEYTFAVQICDQYSCKIWFPCLVKLLEELRIRNEQEGLFLEMHLAMHFILFKLHDTKLIFERESDQYAEHFQITLGALMEQIVLNLQLASVRSRQLRIPADIVKQYKDCANQVLKTITRCMTPSTFFQAATQLLDHTNGSVKRKVLGLLSDTLKDNGLVQKKQKEGRRLKLKSFALPQHLDETVTPSFNKLCLKVAELIDNTTGDLDTAIRVSAISALEVLTKEYPSDNFVYGTCLTIIVENICCDNLAISSAIIRATGSLISVLGSKALSQLPLVMKHMLQKVREFSSSSSKIPNGLTENSTSLLLSILMTLEAIVEKLGGFLNPYLEDILDLVVLHPEYASESDTKIKFRAANVRKLLTEKIPVRLMLPPLIQIYPDATKSGESSLSLTFEMLASLIGVMDKLSIGTYHVRVFEHCLVALDLRRQLPEFKNIDTVEQSVIHAIVVLTMKLTESMFRPLFLHSLEWAESEFEGNQSVSSRSLDRAISFYKLVNKLAEKHRSLFVPYFKYFLDDSVQYLSPDAGLVGLKRKKKKTKVDDAQDHGNDVLSPKQWNLRALVLKSLYQCYLYDTDLKFLDPSNFQVLLKPIVSQLVVEPPSSLESLMSGPTIEEVDETLVMCLGQMAITARSDVLWKPLNHEVLMQMRDGKVRTKMVGLRVVQYLVEHLKEEYLVLLPETIPFLAELLEDVELPVKTLSQDILKELETLSGESLRQYL
ncbi:uncharacterized protein At3g06530 isoform X2 [Typha latifolia]|uniref:uncharacterized protein At3g06530 isoform X2 n=1 Tax=Typha latifolia TaxID=4733 RepID=UPI003C2CE388